MKESEKRKIISIDFAPDYLIINLSDKKEVGFAISKVPWLMLSSESQRNNWTIMNDSIIHWSDLNQGIALAKFNEIGICKLCLEKKLLQKESHLIPRFIFKQSNIIDENGKSNEIIVSKEQKIESVIEKFGSGFIERNILCEDCDQKLIGHVYEDYVAKIIYTNPSPRIAPINKKVIYSNLNNVRADEFENIDKTKFKLYLLSILWRCSISKKPEFQNVKLGDYQEKIRKMILNKDAGRPGEFPFAVFTTQKNQYWTEDIVAIPIRDEGTNGYYYKMLLGSYIMILNISLHQINFFFQSDETKVIVYHLPSHLTLKDFASNNFLARVFSSFIGLKQAS